MIHTRKQREGATVARGKTIAGRIRVSMAQGTHVAILGNETSLGPLEISRKFRRLFAHPKFRGKRNREIKAQAEQQCTCNALPAA